MSLKAKGGERKGREKMERRSKAEKTETALNLIEGLQCEITKKYNF
jgi:hypothetical protein